MPEIGEQTSKRKRDAIDAEREVKEKKKAEESDKMVDDFFAKLGLKED